MSRRWRAATYDTPEWESIPSAPGCYVVYADDRLIYVGSTHDLHQRITNHRFRYCYSEFVITPWFPPGSTNSGRQPIPFNCRRLTVKYRPSVRYGDWAMVELRLIRRLQPLFNKVGKAAIA